MRGVADEETGRRAETLCSEAEEAEADRDFARAYSKFMLAADAFEDAGVREAMQLTLFKAGLALERSQEFRAHAATWRRLAESIGQELSDELGLGHRFRRRIQPGQSRMFSVICHEQWTDPYVGYYAKDPIALARHQQAWAFAWAADGCEMHGSYGTAARANRLSGICWELSRVGELGTLQPCRSEEGRTEPEPIGGPGAKWKLALIHYTRAIVASVRSGEPGERAWLFERGEPRYLGWETGMDAFTPDGGAYEKRRRLEELELGEAALEPQSDLQRLRRCWANFTRDAGLSDHNRVEEVREHAGRLQVIQDALVGAGRRRDAIRVYRERQLFLIDQDPSLRRVRRCWRRADYAVTMGGTSLPRLLLLVGAAYLVVAPSLYWALDAVKHSNEPHRAVGFLDSITFSLANVSGLSVGDLVASGQLAQLAQGAQAVSAYILLGLAIWMLTISYEQG